MANAKYRSCRLTQNKPLSGPASTFMSSSAEFYSFRLSRAVGVNANGEWLLRLRRLDRQVLDPSPGKRKFLGKLYIYIHIYIHTYIHTVTSPTCFSCSTPFADGAALLHLLLRLHVLTQLCCKHCLGITCITACTPAVTQILEHLQWHATLQKLLIIIRLQR